MKRTLKLIIIILTPIIVLLNIASKFSTYLVENLYSEGIDKYVRQFQNFFSGMVKFSIAEILFFSLIIILVIMVISLLIKIRKGGALDQLINICMYLSILYLLFMFLWGFNYNRYTFAKIANLQIQKSSEDELKGLCETLIGKANKLRINMTLDRQGIMTENGGYIDVFNRATKGYEKAALIYTELGGKYGKAKPIFLSELMCYTGITGIYMPFTGEANVNVKIQSVMLPCTTAHEMAHQRGFAREDEANFISYLTCTLNPDEDFQYSGVVLALINSMNALGHKDIDSYRKLKMEYGIGLKKDMDAENFFWRKYSGNIEKVSNQVNNSYLKSNGQNDGTDSYGRMVDLLLALYRKTHNQPYSFLDNPN